MKRHLFLTLCLLCTLFLRAQDSISVQAPVVAAPPVLTYGFLSYETTLKAMPDYAAAQRNIQALRAQYEGEMKRSEEEFNKKYVEFLDGQRDFAPSILKKRQAELQDMMAKNVAFKEESVRLLEKAEADLMAPVTAKLKEAIQRVGREQKLAFVLNTDNNALPYVDEIHGLDITTMVLKAIGK